jgi:hypothetical protein
MCHIEPKKATHRPADENHAFGQAKAEYFSSGVESTADLHGAKWREIAEIKLANVFGVKNAPAGFLERAAKMGAVSIESDAGWLARFNLD